MKVRVTFDLGEDELAAIRLAGGEIGRASRADAEQFLRDSVQWRLSAMVDRLEQVKMAVVNAAIVDLALPVTDTDA